MDLQALVEPFDKIACIVSVPLSSEGSGELKIVAANSAYRASVGIQDDGETSDRPYEHYIPRDLNFSNFCYQCAVLKKQLHSYQKDEKLGCWMDIIMLPINVDDPDNGYCICTFEISQEEEPDKLAQVSYENANDVLSAAIKLRSSWDFMTSMHSVVKDIRELCGARRCCILLTDDEAHSCRVLTHDSTDITDEAKVGEIINETFYSIVRTWADTFKVLTCLVVQTDNDWEELEKRNPVWYKSLKDAEVSSLIMFPLVSKGETLGYIWASDFQSEKTLRIMETLKLTTFFIASEIANQRLLERLEHMSITDVLTGLYNRNAMNLRVARFPEDEDFGIVFADVNGLKVINDTCGHGAGDELLKAAAEILKEVFAGHEIYRMGGDEFMVIVTDVNRARFDMLMERLKYRAEDGENVSFAVGGCYDDGAHDLRRALHMADALMYKDKERHYSDILDRE